MALYKVTLDVSISYYLEETETIEVQASSEAEAEQLARDEICSSDYDCCDAIMGEFNKNVRAIECEEEELIDESYRCPNTPDMFELLDNPPAGLPCPATCA